MRKRLKVNKKIENGKQRMQREQLAMLNVVTIFSQKYAGS